MSWTSLCDLDELKEGEGKYVEIGGFQLAVFLDKGNVYVTDNTCPHAGGNLSAGVIEEGCVLCPWHYWAFRLENGQLRDLPGVAIATYKTRIVEPQGKPKIVQADLPIYESPVRRPMCRRISRAFALASIFVFVLLGAGCSATPPDLVSRTPLPPGSTYLLHLPGIAGDTAFDRWWMNAIADGGAADRAELYDWTCDNPGIPALQAYRRNCKEAQKVSNLIRNQRTADPKGHFILTAESGGTGIAVWALERLPDGVYVDDAILVAPAISPGYDLSRALRHVRGRMYYTSSGGDWFVLGVGTSVFGTMDRKNTNAAGFVGFHRPHSGNTAQYSKLIEMKYRPEWARWGDLGTHVGGMSPNFARHVLVPMLLHDESPAIPARQASLKISSVQ